MLSVPATLSSKSCSPPNRISTTTKERKFVPCRDTEHVGTATSIDDMTTRSYAAAKAAVAAATLTVSNGLGASVRPQQLAQSSHMLCRRSISITLYRSSATALTPSAVLNPSAQPRDSSRRRVGKNKHYNLKRKTTSEVNAVVQYVEVPPSNNPLHNATPVAVLRMLAPESYSGKYREAHDLDAALAGAADWVPPKLADLASRPEELRAALEQHLSDRKMRHDLWLSLRNAMLAQSWPDARRQMINIDDARWPGFVLRRAVRTVTTPSEISDSLALLDSAIQYASKQALLERHAYFRPLRYCVSTLTFRILKQDQSAVHLIPRLADILSSMVDVFPIQMTSSPQLLSNFTRGCTEVADDRARHGVIKLLDRLQSTSTEADRFRSIRHEIVRHCINSIEVLMKKTGRMTGSSEQFVNTDLMERLLRQGFSPHSDLEQRALQCAVFVAGRNRDHARTWHYFNQLQQRCQKHSATISMSDYLVLAKALIRSKQGRKDAWSVFLQAETQVLARSADVTATSEELEDTCIHLLEVMAKSEDVRLESVLSLLGIAGSHRHESQDVFIKMADAVSKAMRRPRVAVVVYTMVMQGCLLRRRSEEAVTVWQTMQERGVLPNAACLSVYLQNLFDMEKVGEAMRQLHLWCEEGVDDLRSQKHEATTAIQSAHDESAQLASFPIRQEVSRYKVRPDPILASVVFSGLHKCGTSGIEALWDAYQQTIRLFPDAPSLSLLLKVSCNGDTTSSINAQFSHQMFRSLLFAKHPELTDYRNPIRQQLQAHGTASWIFSDDTVGSKMEKWLASVFQTREIKTPVVPSDLSGLVFTSKVFESYVRLLLHLQHSPGLLTDARFSRQELIDVLGWMKELNLAPSTTHLALTILEIEEHLPPAVAGRQMELLEAWLVDWLGEERLPTEPQMRRHWHWKMKRNEQKRGWFDRVRLGGPDEPIAG